MKQYAHRSVIYKKIDSFRISFDVGTSHIDVMMSVVKCSLHGGQIEILFKTFSLDVVFSYFCKVLCTFNVINKTKNTNRMHSH